VPVGTGGVSSGALVSNTAGQEITITPDVMTLDYTFVVDGVIYTARYTLGTAPPPVLYRNVIVRRVQDLDDCASPAAASPVIDAIEVLRGGVAVASGGQADWTVARCPGFKLAGKAPAALSGAPDGDGVALGGGDLAWPLSGGGEALEHGDQVRVTVLDGDTTDYEVWAGASIFDLGIKLGVLRGTGVVLFP
jgi:hypothetical protein